VGQVLRNLLNNAVAHTPEAGEITVTGRAASVEVAVSVRDTGMGIPSEHLPYIFDRFYRADKSRARQTGGAGLGLAIAKQLVIAHGGSISAENTPGQGTTFTFTLPVAQEG
jgi:signal transduction histidine kinase